MINEAKLYEVVENFTFRGKLRKVGERLIIVDRKVEAVEGKVKLVTDNTNTMPEDTTPAATPEVVPEAPVEVVVPVEEGTAAPEAPVVTDTPAEPATAA